MLWFWFYVVMDASALALILHAEYIQMQYYTICQGVSGSTTTGHVARNDDYCVDYTYPLLSVALGAYYVFAIIMFCFDKACLRNSPKWSWVFFFVYTLLFYATFLTLQIFLSTYVNMQTFLILFLTGRLGVYALHNGLLFLTLVNDPDKYTCSVVIVYTLVPMIVFGVAIYYNVELLRTIDVTVYYGTVFSLTLLSVIILYICKYCCFRIYIQEGYNGTYVDLLIDQYMHSVVIVHILSLTPIFFVLHMCKRPYTLRT